MWNQLKLPPEIVHLPKPSRNMSSTLHLRSGVSNGSRYLRFSSVVTFFGGPGCEFTLHQLCKNHRFIMPPQCCLESFCDQAKPNVSKLTITYHSPATKWKGHEGHAAPYVSHAFDKAGVSWSLRAKNLEIALAKCRQRENWQQEPVPRRSHHLPDFKADSEAPTLTAGWLWAAARTAAPAS